jgi:hypothetical protein
MQGQQEIETHKMSGVICMHGEKRTVWVQGKGKKDYCYIISLSASEQEQSVWIARVGEHDNPNPIEEGRGNRAGEGREIHATNHSQIFRILPGNVGNLLRDAHVHRSPRSANPYLASRLVV